MAKKSKRQSRRSSGVSSAYASSSGSRSLSTDFDPDYTYVISDLKRIGILAGSFFVVLVILAFIL